MTGLDSNITSLLNQTVSWEAYAGSSTTFGDPNWLAAKNKLCFLEEKGLGGEVSTIRRDDDTVYDPSYVMYFDANDTDVQGFTMKDRFTVRAVASSETIRSRPKSITLFVGSSGENWIKVVQL